MIGIHGGTSSTQPNDVHFEEANGTDVLIGDVHWFSMSFGSPPYYGLRIVRWLDKSSPWGVGVDFTHTMMIAELKDSVDISGSYDGTPVSGRERLWNLFDNLQFSNGHSIVSANLFYRRPYTHAIPTGLIDRIHPYGGLGLGLATPHVEVETQISKTSSYQIGGIAFVGNAGTMVYIGNTASLLFEYRISRANIHAGLEGGGSLDLVSWTHHLHLGIVFIP
jgi:lipid A oxidase